MIKEYDEEKEEKKRPRKELGKGEGELGRWRRDGRERGRGEKKRRRAGGEKKEEAVIPRPSNNFHPLLTAFSASLEPSQPYFLATLYSLYSLYSRYSCLLYESNPCHNISIKHKYPIYILLKRKNIIKVDIAMLTTRNTAR